MKNYQMLGLAIIISGLLLLLFGTDFEMSANWQENLYNRLAMMFAVAVLIERSIEVYLDAYQKNGPDRFSVAGIDADDLREVAKGEAARLGIVLGILAALAGVRLMTVFGEPVKDLDAIWGSVPLMSLLWFGLDVIISAGLLAGGAKIFHDIVEVLRGGIGKISGAMQPKTIISNELMEVTKDNNFTPDTSYTITINRQTDRQGTLSFESGSVVINTTCWWDPDEPIRKGTYTSCSKTIMATKRYKSVFIKGARSPSSTIDDIFIHQGSKPEHSDGCFVIVKAEMERLYGAIRPSDGQNVTVIVED